MCQDLLHTRLLQNHLLHTRELGLLDPVRLMGGEEGDLRVRRADAMQFARGTSRPVGHKVVRKLLLTIKLVPVELALINKIAAQVIGESKSPLQETQARQKGKW